MQVCDSEHSISNYRHDYHWPLKQSSNKALPGKPHSSAGHRLNTWDYGRTTGLKSSCAAR